MTSEAWRNPMHAYHFTHVNHEYYPLEPSLCCSLLFDTHNILTMSDALCGPSNPLQNFQKHSQADRSLQQDRLTSRGSPAQVCDKACDISDLGTDMNIGLPLSRSKRWCSRPGIRRLSAKSANSFHSLHATRAVLISSSSTTLSPIPTASFRGT